MEGVEVPQYFLCPISLQIMRDPVALSTGITYDRENIEQWIFSSKRDDCPVTKQLLPDLHITPNHALRRLIQAWCAEHASDGFEQFPTPRPPVDRSQIVALLNEAKLPQTHMSALQRLKNIVLESDRNKQCVEAAGAANFLALIIKNSISNPRDEEQEEWSDGVESRSSACDEALAILCSLQLSEEGILDLLRRNDDFIESLTTLLSQSNDQSQAHALLLLKSLVSVVPPARLLELREVFFTEIVKLLHDKIPNQAMKAALQVLSSVSSSKRNRVKAVQAGAIHVLIELLLGKEEKRACEMVLVVLDQLCGCAEGRAELVAHAAGIAVVSKKILRVSQVASALSVRILCSVAKLSPSPAVLQEILQVGAVSKLCLLLEVDCGVKIQDKVKELLRLHSRVWRNSPCLDAQLQTSYP